MLNIVGNKSAIEKRKKEEAKFEQLELDLEKGEDLSSTFDFLRANEGLQGRRGGLLGFLLRRGGSALLKRSLSKIYRRVIPKRLQVRARQIRRIPSKYRGKLVNKFTRMIPGIAGRKIRNIVGREVAEGAAKRQIKKQLVKQGGKVASKKMPGLGWIAGSIFALERALKGDMEGAALEFASGLAGSIPTVGTGISLGIDAYIIQRDVQKGMELERGNVNVKSIGMGTDIDSISEILSVTKAFGEAAGFSPAISSLIDSEGLSGYPIPRANYVFDVGGRSFGGDNIQQDVPEEDEEELKKIDKKLKKNDGTDTTNPKRGAGEGKGGIGGDPVKAITPIMGGDGATIEFWGQQGRDLSGEPGVDFSYKDYKSNYNLFPGYVLETGLLYGDRYGNVVVVRSTDPSNGLEFDSLYSHFPDGGIAVKPGQWYLLENILVRLDL